MELPHFHILNHYSHLHVYPWTPFCPWSPGSGYSFEQRSLSTWLPGTLHPPLLLNILLPQISPLSLYHHRFSLHCFIPTNLHALLFLILKTLFPDPMSPSHNHLISLFYATKVLERIIYSNFLYFSSFKIY